MNRWSRRWIAVTLAVAATATLGTDAVARGRPATPPQAGERADKRGGPADVRPGEVLVKVAPNDAPGLQRALTKINAAAVRSIGRGISVVGVEAGREHEAAAALADDPGVEYAEPNYIRTAAAHSSAEVGWGVRVSRAPTLWHEAEAITGDGVRVAVIDSGVDKTHDQLAGRVSNGYDPYNTAGRDECGHGTAVAGVIAAAADGRSTVGVAPGVTIVPVKVLRYDDFQGCAGDDASIIAGLNWAADQSRNRGHADIINMSLSGPQPSNALRDAVNHAAQQGVLVVSAAGNTGDRETQYPAAYANVLSVGGVQRSGDSVAWWPNTSFATVDVAAAAKGVPVITARGAKPSLVATPCAGPTGWCADGTSFAAPHVAGVAALLFERHALATVAPGARLRQLNQWILGTARRVPGARAGVDLKTGHGAVDAVSARDASLDAGRQLLTWHTSPRIIRPTRRMAAETPAVSATFVATTGTGAVLANRQVTLLPDAGGSVASTRTATSSTGRVSTRFRSTAAGRTTRLVAVLGSRSLPLDVYVLQRDDNIPGVRLPRSPLRNSLNIARDIDDVFRVYLADGETLRARVRGIGRNEYVDMFLHRSGTRDVTNPFLAPLAEPAPYDNDPRRLRRTVHSDGVRFLDVYGYGTYRLNWSIYSPGKVRSLTANPKTITPNSNGVDDRARISWRLARPGNVAVRIADADGKVVRRANLGGEARGRRSWWWNGRTRTGRLAGAGTFRVTVLWNNRAGRVCRASTKVSVRR